MHEKLADNPEFRRTLLWSAALVAAFFLLLAFLWNGESERVHRQTIARELGQIGMLVSLHPEWKDDIAKSFAREPQPDELTAGVEAAARFGLDERLPLTADAELDRLYIRGLLYIAGTGLLLMAAFALLWYRRYRAVFLTVNRYAELAERIVDGDFRVKAERPVEGAFSRLAHQFNQMSARLEQSLDRLNREKETMKRLLSDISHQLKTPLSSLKMFNELLADDLEQNRPADREFVGKSMALIGKMEWLIKQLLTVARLEAGVIELHRKLLPLGPTLEEAARPLAALADARGVKLTLDLTNPAPERESAQDARAEPGPRPASAAEAFRDASLLSHDPAWLGEAIANIVKNGIEHTPPGGAVKIRLSDTAVMARIVVEDAGGGISPADLPHIFERFYRGTSRIVENAGGSGGGTGIGLPLAKAIVESHGGFITVSSCEGRGTTMTLTFPKLKEAYEIVRQSVTGT